MDKFIIPKESLKTSCAIETVNKIVKALNSESKKGLTFYILTDPRILTEEAILSEEFEPNYNPYRLYGGTNPMVVGIAEETGETVCSMVFLYNMYLATFRRKGIFVSQLFKDEELAGYLNINNYLFMKVISTAKPHRNKGYAKDIISVLNRNQFNLLFIDSSKTFSKALDELGVASLTDRNIFMHLAPNAKVYTTNYNSFDRYIKAEETDTYLNEYTLHSFEEYCDENGTEPIMVVGYKPNELLQVVDTEGSVVYEGSQILACATYADSRESFLHVDILTDLVNMETLRVYPEELKNYIASSTGHIKLQHGVFHKDPYMLSGIDSLGLKRFYSIINTKAMFV